MLILLTITSRKKQTTATIILGIISNPEGISILRLIWPKLKYKKITKQLKNPNNYFVKLLFNSLNFTINSFLKRISYCCYIIKSELTSILQSSVKLEKRFYKKVVWIKKNQPLVKLLKRNFTWMTILPNLITISELYNQLTKKNKKGKTVFYNELLSILWGSIRVLQNSHSSKIWILYGNPSTDIGRCTNIKLS